MKFVTAASAALLGTTVFAAPLMLMSGDSSLGALASGFPMFAPFLIGSSNPGTVKSGTPSDMVQTDTPSATYKIQDFTTRKYDGQHINTVSFKIVAFNAETLADCSSENFVMNQRYTCSNGRFSFTYVDYYDWVKPTELFIREETDDKGPIGGSINFITPPCRAGGSGPEDLTCQIPDSQHVQVGLFPAKSN
ncbi:Major allergen Alt [Lasiodiplodia theobromae]|uniref:Major allergen Alt n=1 Tax=Lasiodiplodia theobromae TaxID=45133 RepID=UPI0015C35BD5|nr:Major allergen Alt [Lasiodiplodia theobromae]KAF4540719.1 Major allergen Alt [Lasiodiplodia theobromae]